MEVDEAGFIFSSAVECLEFADVVVVCGGIGRLDCLWLTVVNARDDCN